MHRLLSLLLVFALTGAFLCASRVHAAGRDLEREAVIERELGEIDPALVEPFRKARILHDNNDAAAAEPLLREVVTRAPGFDAGWRRLGSVIVHQGRRAEGLALLEHALGMRRSTANLASLAFSLGFGTDKSSPPSERDRQRALDLLTECRALPNGNESDILAASTQLALGLNNLPLARETTARLERDHPKEVSTHYLAAIIAAHDQEWIRSEDEILEAGKLGLSDEAVREFLASGIHRAALPWRVARNTAWTVAIWALGLVTLFAAGWLLSRLTLRRINQSDPRIPISDGERRLRRTYRVVLNLAGVYYYISLPIVLVLVIAVAVVLVGGLLMLGFIPIYLTLMIIVGALATIVSMIRAFFVRVNHADPGEVLSREEAAGLWQLVEEVAVTLHTRPIDEIRITPGTDLCVYERGGWRERMNNRAKRVLVIGAAVLQDFKQDEFRSVLAHEYGHFAHRDTAGGDIGLRVRNDIIKFYVAMVNAEQNTWLNVAFHFLRLYHFLFRRISHGATRLQEILADRVAAQAYGPAAFQGGLTHVIRQNIVFHERANREIDAAIKASRPIQNLYDPLPDDSPGRDTEIEKALARPTTDDDTHPGPRDRFRFVAPLPEPVRAAQSGLVWDLFTDRDTLVRRLLAQVEKDIAPHRG